MWNARGNSKTTSLDYIHELLSVYNSRDDICLCRFVRKCHRHHFMRLKLAANPFDSNMVTLENWIKIWKEEKKNSQQHQQIIILGVYGFAHSNHFNSIRFSRWIICEDLLFEPQILIIETKLLMNCFESVLDISPNRIPVHPDRAHLLVIHMDLSSVRDTTWVLPKKEEKPFVSLIL